MIKNHITIAWRNIKKHIGFSLINAGGLTLGIASFLLLLLYISYHLEYDHQFKNLKNIYIVENNQPGDGQIYTFASTPGLLAPSIKSEIPGVEQVARAESYTADGLITYNNNSFKKSGLFADPGFFSIFSYHFIEGNAASALAQPNSIVITKDLAQTLFGNQDAINKIVMRNNKLPMIVSGVIDNIPVNESFQFDFVMPYSIFESENAWVRTSDWGNNFCQTYVQLKGPSAFNRANNILGTTVKRHASDSKEQLFLYPYAQLHLHSEFKNGKPSGGLIEQIHLFEILAFCILLVACVNFMNLSTARSGERAKEVGIRKAIGSGRSSLVSQFMAESLIISFISTMAAIFILFICVSFFNDLLNIKLVLPIDNVYAWLLVIGIAVLTGLISGSYPAFYLSSFQPIKVLKGVFKGGKSALSIRKVLVVVQFGFAVFLITATICIYQQIRFIQSKSIGYNKNNLIEIPLEGNLAQKTDVLINELKNKGAITSATTLSLNITENGNNTWGVDWPGKLATQKVLIDIFNTGYEFTETAGVKLIAGREFSKQYPIDTANNTVMINESAAKIMNLKNPVGTVIKWGDHPLTIIGVYKDFVRGSPYQRVEPTISTFAGSYASTIAMRLNPERNLTANIDQINKSLKEINPAYPPTVHFADSEFEKKFNNEKLLATLANLFGGLAIIISCLGLFGLVAYAAEQRTKEIGVRKVLGATVANLAGLLSKDFMKLVAIAIFITIPVSVWALNSWLSKYEYRITLNWWIIALASIITIGIALLTVSYQAVKAALANPVKSLRSE